MNFNLTVGNYLRNKGQNLIMKEYVAKYGVQVGKTAHNGNMAFAKKEGETTVMTGLDRFGDVLAIVRKNGDKIKGHTTKEAYKDGVLDKVYTSHIATNYRRNVATDLKTGEVVQKTYSANPISQEYSVTTTKMGYNSPTTDIQKGSIKN